MNLWDWEELEAALGSGGRDLAGAAPSGVSIDTRTLRPGDLFVALSGDPGPRFRASGSGTRDGHEFIADAVKAGARALLVSRDVPASVPTFRVADTLDGLWDLGRYARHRCEARVVAITGSSGKTTARAFIQALLGEQGRVHATEGSLNNHWGVPLSLARMPRDSEFGVFEVGTNHPGEIAPLVGLIEPHVALLLNVAPAHFGNFPGLDAIRREKLSIATGLRPGGTLVAPAELDLSGSTAERLVTFGWSADADVCCEEIRIEGTWVVTARIGNRRLEFSLVEGGRHRVATALASLAVAHALGADLRRAGSRLGEVTSPPGRGNRHRIGEIVVVDDSYNANPSSMAFALDLLAASSARRRVAILGDMLELGETAGDLHRELAAHCAGVDRLLLVGPLMWHLYDALPRGQRWSHVESAAQLDLTALVAALEPGDEVLVKGSNRMFWVNRFVPRLCEALNGKDSGPEA